MGINFHTRLLATTVDRGIYQPVTHLHRPAKQAVAESISRASLWLSRSGIQNTSYQNGAVGCWYDLSKRQIPYAYSEITGYGISTFLKLSEISRYYGDYNMAQEFRNKAFAAGNWIIEKAQYPEGLVKPGYYYKNDELGTNLDSRIYKDGTVSKKYFSEIVLSHMPAVDLTAGIKLIWGKLIENGYINSEGEILRKFIELSRSIEETDKSIRSYQKIGTAAEDIDRLETARQRHFQLMGFSSQSANQAIFGILDRSKDRIAFLFDNGMILSGLIGLYEAKISRKEDITESMPYIRGAHKIIDFIFEKIKYGIVKKESFANEMPDIYLSHLWTDLVNKEYIYSDGTVRSKFKNLKSSAEMFLSPIYDDKKNRIFDLIQQSYIPTWPVFNFTNNMAQTLSPKDSGYRWSYDFGAYNVKLVIGLLRYAMVNDNISDPRDLMVQYAHADDRERFLAVNLAKDLVEEALKLQSKRSGRFMINRTLAQHKPSHETFLQTYAHHHLYATEGILWAGAILNREDYIKAALNAYKWILTKQLAVTGGIARYYDNYGKPMMPAGADNEPYESSDIIAQTLRLGVLFYNIKRLSYGLHKLSFDFEPPKLDDMFEGALDSLAARLLQYQYAHPDNNPSFDSQAYGGFYYGSLARAERPSLEISNLRNEAGFDSFINNNSQRYEFSRVTDHLAITGEMTADERDLLLDYVSADDRIAIESLYRQSQGIRKPHINSWSTMFSIQALHYYFMYRNMYVSQDDFAKILGSESDSEILVNDLRAKGYINTKGEVLDEFKSLQNFPDLNLDDRFIGLKEKVYNILKVTGRIHDETTFDIHLFV